MVSMTLPASRTDHASFPIAVLAASSAPFILVLCSPLSFVPAQPCQAHPPLSQPPVNVKAQEPPEGENSLATHATEGGMAPP